MMPAIQPIVEGHGDVQAVPVLLRRLLHEAGVYDLQINPPTSGIEPNLRAK